MEPYTNTYIYVCMYVCMYVFINVRVHAQFCPTLCDPMDYSPPGSSVHGIFQVRILEWVAISFSRSSSQPLYSRNGTHLLCLLHSQVDSIPLTQLRNPINLSNMLYSLIFKITFCDFACSMPFYFPCYTLCM